ncbi:hypothetical protein BVC80_8409g2 [Macleaya cordata]|uniref:WPP domain-associated protein n=1 Tax=Macleaya cordata TaxID=56857 RepID=A0A200Q5T7_MACCD|nr:hypothetical protein BVC80_8409g2 [Macleaya cordata]
MENSGVFEGSGAPDAVVASFSYGSIQPSFSLKGSANLGDDLLDDLDSYLEDINDRLTISRMVNDSVIKGMVNAVTEEATERINLKEKEVALLKERLHFYESGIDKFEEPKFSCFSDTLEEQDDTQGYLGNLKIEAEEQFRKLRKDIEDIKGCSLIARVNSRSDLGGQSGTLQGKGSEKWVEIDKSLSDLKNIIMKVCDRVDSMVYLSKTSLCEWRQEREFQEELEAIVIQNSIRSLHDQFEAKLWEQKAQICGSQSINQLAKINELSSLRDELDAISKSLSSSETGMLLSQGSYDSEDTKRKDHFHRKVLSNHISAPSSLTEGNGKHESNRTTLETMDSAQLKHMSKDELINYFKTEMTKMKRNNESVVQDITEKYFSLKREFLKERDPSSPLRKDKEFDSLRKKIPEVILKLDDILMESEKLPVVYDNAENLCGLKGRLDTLLSENRRLKDSLSNKRREVKSLSAQVSDAANKMSHHSLAEANLLKQIRKLKCDIEDTKIEISVREEIHKCILRDMIGKIKWHVEDSRMESVAVREICEIVLREALMDPKATIEWGVEDSDMESITMQEMCGIIFREAIKDAEATINMMKMEYEKEHERRVSLEASLLESEKTLSLEIKEKEWLKQEMLLISASMEEKEKLALEAGSTLMKEKEHFDLICQELNRLRDQVSQQERLISESSMESNLINSKLEAASDQMRLYDEQISKLDQKLKLAMKDLKLANEETKLLHDIIQEKQNVILSLEGKEMEHKKQIESIITTVQRLSKTAADFERRAVEDVEKNNLRLDNLNFHCNPLLQKVNLFRKMETMYKQKLERRYSDLQKAEAEVDLLGDEVDALLSLLEKIYVALDHYSSILQHYPGVDKPGIAEICTCLTSRFARHILANLIQVWSGLNVPQARLRLSSTDCGWVGPSIGLGLDDLKLGLDFS